MVSRTRPEPLYHQVVDEIRRRVSSGEWKAEQRVPSERELAQELGVSRITVRHAVRLAAAEGMVRQQRGVGTFVGESGRLAEDLAHIRSFEHTLEGRGQVASTKIVDRGITNCDLQLSGTLRIEPGSLVLNMRLLGCGDSSPVVLYNSFFGHALGQEMDAAAKRLSAAHRPFSTLDLYREDEVTRSPSTLSQTIEAIAATNELAERLELERNAPILLVESVMSDGQGPLEFRRAYYRADQYRFSVARRVI